MEAIVAAACSRIGKKVLHVDRNMYYGGNWSTFNLKDLEEWLAAHRPTEIDTTRDTGIGDTSNAFLNEDETSLNIGGPSNSTGNVTDLDVAFITRGLESEQSIPQQTTADQLSVLPSEASTAERAANKQEDVSTLDDTAKATEENANTSDTTNDEQRPSVGINATEDDAEDSDPVLDPVVSSNGQQTTEPITWNAIKNDWRRFNIDLAPKFLFSRGAMVDILIKSSISRYLEFKAVLKFLTYLPNGTFQQVPQSRSDVFSSSSISMLEKRILMKFLSFCLEYEQNEAEYKEYSQRPFIEFLHARQLTDNLQHFVLYAIAMKTEDATTEEGLQACQKYLKSLGRFGNTPFLWPLYGVGELPQGFCRLCAVFGGIYVLRRSIEKVIVDGNSQFCAIVSETKRLNASWLIGGFSYLSTCLSTSMPSIKIGSRGIFVTDKSIYPGSEENITFLTVPPHAANSPGLVQVIELPSISFACPRHVYIVHLLCKSSGKTAKEDLEETARLLFDFNTVADSSNGSKPKVLWRMYFSQTSVASREEANACLPGNVVLTSQPDSELGFDSVVAEAKSIFERICPNEEFLPTPPDPEDIIYEPEEVQNLPSSNPGHGANKEIEERQSNDQNTEQKSDKEVHSDGHHDTDELSGKG